MYRVIPGEHSRKDYDRNYEKYIILPFGEHQLCFYLIAVAHYVIINYSQLFKMYRVIPDEHSRKNYDRNYEKYIILHVGEHQIRFYLIAVALHVEVYFANARDGSEGVNQNEKVRILKFN